MNSLSMKVDDPNRRLIVIITYVYNKYGVGWSPTLTSCSGDCATEKINFMGHNLQKIPETLADNQPYIPYRVKI